MKRKRYYIVYKHTCVITNNVYIGITSQSWQRRWNNGQGYKSCNHMHKAIMKYGPDNFIHEILYEGLTKEEAQEKEIELILEYKSNNPEFGYNVSSGGESHNGCKGMHYQTEESKAKISAAHKGKTIPDSVKKKMSEAHKGKHAKPTWLNTEEQRNRTRARMKGNHYASLRKSSGKNKPVISIDPNGVITEYESLKSAAILANTSPNHIYEVCVGKRKTAGKLKWKYK